MKIGIIGGGISGVAAAFWIDKMLSEEGIDGEITLLEKDNSLGGSIGTVEKEGFTIESGPNGFLNSKPHTLQLFDDADLNDNLLPSNDAARKRFIMRDSKLVKLPEKPGEFLTSDILSFQGKLRVAAELFIPKKKNNKDETVAEFATRRLGKEACEYLISPMVSGVFAGDPYKLSLKSCFPVIADLEETYGGLFKGMLRKKNKKSGPAGPGGVLTSYRGGLINALDDLSNKTKNVEYRLGDGVNRVEKIHDKFHVKTASVNEFDFDHLVVTCPSYVASEFFKDMDNELSASLNEIHYAPAFVVGFGLDEEDVKHDLDGFGYLIPPKENRKILGALFTSSIFPERAPEGKKLVRVIMGGDRNPWIVGKPEEELVLMALEGINDTLGIKGHPEVVQYFKWNMAIPQYYQGHSKIVKSIEKASEGAGDLYIGGNILYGIGINDCTRTSFEIAEKLVQNIKAQQ
ncbi:MAG: protoporphyrinogen oxidase [Flexistipes sinusarabici]|uniref:Coproporphyrinogen III oxidase n=1 Tax=Flexistipes sinusarabici TaxID=2352 RepID=A0A5D0MNJ0_FLESI|nr:protoporphyrinogen oxidase [Flexistipes sinusarabici]TYB33041.1 MAG: protoporphyrinogen oxidase [Flexistipes sinusarabici]